MYCIIFSQRISDQLLSPSVVETGGTFTVTCDASRAGVPTTATTVRTLVIEWSDGTQQLKPLARYGHNGTQYDAKGPKDVTFQWKFGSRLSNFNSFTPYSVQNATSVAEPVLVSSGATCVQYIHSSTLKFQTEEKYDGYTYVCVATENNKNTIVGNMTLYTKTGKQSPYTSQPLSETLVNPKAVDVGGSFTVTCDASRAGVPTNATTILSLTVARRDGEKEPITLARYNTLTFPYESSIPPKTSHGGKKRFYFSGRINKTSDRLNNRNTMMMNMTVNDAGCPDDGVYICTAIYFNSNNDVLMRVGIRVLQLQAS
ncbi:uncharacterized protein LOC131936187 [Physella acuta]|uniref:uncharacterized protein LOC131936187 n=1 Tax=Physella acuta TaxID=109671 RepID=UPI0027DD018A|nr:uncharacterized protein LOC131936187 [Physella acuta]